MMDEKCIIRALATLIVFAGLLGFTICSLLIVFLWKLIDAY